MQPTILINDLTFTWPDGSTVVRDLDVAIGSSRTGLVGANGSGKSTLLRLVAGDLVPTRGTVTVHGRLGYLAQDFTLDADRPVDDVVGIAPARRALQAIERGVVTDAELAAVGDDWDVEERAHAILDRLGLAHVSLDRRVSQLSGGEAVLLGFAAQVLRRPDVLLLDEPTNNLDRAARQRLYEVVSSWSGTLMVVSHDRALLDLVDQVIELRDGGVRRFGGNFRAYEAAVAAEQESAGRLLRAAESDARRQQRELIEARTKLDRRKRYGQKMWDSKREPKIVMGARKRAAQVSAGKHLNGQLDRLDEAHERLRNAAEAIRDDAVVRIDLPETAVPAGRTVLTAHQAVLRNGVSVDLVVRGPERVALVGANGSGKTTLLETVVGGLAPLAGSVTASVPIRYLPQRLDVLDDERSVVDNVRRVAPAADNAVRARLARFLFRGARADQVVGSLSGGERFRATLAALLLAEPPPQLLLLDEPTNNLDLASVVQLTQALTSYRGALIVASHDVPFLRSIGVTRWLRLEDSLEKVDPQ